MCLSWVVVALLVLPWTLALGLVVLGLARAWTWRQTPSPLDWHEVRPRR